MKAKAKFTRLWSILIALAMVVGMLPIAALAAGSATATETADFSADPTAALDLLNAAKTGTKDSTWDDDTSTLTLNGVNFETTAAAAVKLPDGAKIVLNGENIIKGGSGSGNCYGIEGEGSILQYDVLEQCEQNDCTPSYSQVFRMHKADREGLLTKPVIQDIMCEEKANQREMFKVPMERIRQYVPNANAKQAEDFVLKACEHYRKYLRNRNRDSR